MGSPRPVVVVSRRDGIGLAPYRRLYIITAGAGCLSSHPQFPSAFIQALDTYAAIGPSVLAISGYLHYTYSRDTRIYPRNSMRKHMGRTPWPSSHCGCSEDLHLEVMFRPVEPCEHIILVSSQTHLSRRRKALAPNGHKSTRMML